jgi:hypothetical protein
MNDLLVSNLLHHICRRFVATLPSNNMGNNLFASALTAMRRYWRSSRSKVASSYRRRPVGLNNTVIPSIPVDILLVILEHVDKATLVTMCKVNKVCCSCSQDVLYREIKISRPSEFRVYQTLAQSTHLARRVRSFKIRRNSDDPNIHGALQNMINLRRLSLRHHNHFNLLVGCTFTLISFTYRSNLGFQLLHQFLLTQPSLTSFSLVINSNIDHWPELGAACLPKLTHVNAPFSKLPQLIPNRPVKKVVSHGSLLESKSVDFSFFTRSTVPIKKLTIGYSYLYATPIQSLASIFPSLTHLKLGYCSSRINGGVREPAFINNLIINNYVIGSC